MANGFSSSSPGVNLIEAILQGPSDISAKFFGEGGFAPTGREGGETALDAFTRLFAPKRVPATQSTDALGFGGGRTAGERTGAPAQQILPAGLFQQAGPITFETMPGGGQRARVITGGFAPGTIGATIQAMLPQILASLTGAGGGGPTREDLLAPRLGDIQSREQAARNAILDRFAALGRSAVGSTTTEALGELGRQAGISRQGAFGDVDRILADIATARQGNLFSLIKFLMGAGA
ncbi:MAG: hypothetical protein ACREBU_16490 [Nitrososphaera sp.]